MTTCATSALPNPQGCVGSSPLDIAGESELRRSHSDGRERKPRWVQPPKLVFGGKPVDLWGAQRAASFLPQTKCQALDLLMLDGLMVHENFVPRSLRAPTPTPARQLSC